MPTRPPVMAPTKGTRPKRQSRKTASAVAPEPKVLVDDDTPPLLDDVTCKICLDILVEPVTMPCGHTLCSPCFESCVQKANLSCPMCRKRISVWCRQGVKGGASLVNESLWRRILKTFPDRVRCRTEGREEDRDPDEYCPVVAMHQFAAPGEILQEFEAERRRVGAEEERRRLDEERASAQLLAQAEAEAAQLELQKRMMEEDEALAQRLSVCHSPRHVSSDAAAAAEAATTLKTPASVSRKRPRKSPSGSAAANATPTSAKRTIGSFFQSRAGASGGLATPVRAVDSVDGGRVVVNDEDKDGEKENDDDDDRDEDDDDDDGDGGGDDESLAQKLARLERRWLRQKERQERADREMARRLQKELDQQHRTATTVNRSKSSHDAYALRSAGPKQSSIRDAFLKRTSLPPPPPPPQAQDRLA